MPTIGVIAGAEQILWYSSTEITRYMNLIKYAISFASNLRDGRLDEIAHTPFVSLDGESCEKVQHRLVIKPQEFLDKREKISLYFCMDYQDGEIEHHSAALSLLDLFVEKFVDRVKIKKKNLEKYNLDNESFTSTCDDIYKEIMLGFDLIQADAASFLMEKSEQEEKQMNLLFAAISIQGMAIVSHFYEDISHHFRIMSNGSEEAIATLDNLISAQLSTLVYQSLVQGTSVNYIALKFSDFETFTERTIVVNFTPITEELDGECLTNPDGYVFITLCEGDPFMVQMFQRSITPLLFETGLLNQRFMGNLEGYAPLKEVLENFPRTLSI